MNRMLKLSFTLASFFIPFIIILSNANFSNLGFADASEFTLLTKFAGVAHAPGFPAYIFFAFLFSKISALFGISHIASLVIFSAACVAAASLFLFLSSKLILEKLFSDVSATDRNIISLVTAIVPSCGATIWHWAHSVEVYGFQLLATGILIYGLTWFEVSRKNVAIILAAAGYGLGLANHHLSMILLSPFMLLLLLPGWLSVKSTDKKKKNVEEISLFAFLKEKQFKYFVLTTITCLFVFYGWMMMRASAVLPFAFGSPGNIDRLFYHLAGGAWIKNTQQEVKGIVAMRFPYFMQLKLDQFLFFIPLLITGLISLFHQKSKRLFYAATGFYVVVLFYQLRIDQTADTDAYMTAPYYILCLLLPAGMAMLVQKNKKLIYIFPFLLLPQIGLNYPKTDLKNFDLSTSLMKDLDKSAPKGSVILIADWTSVITYTNYRNEFDFRPDLFVLNYDIKFTNYRLLERNYPKLYQFIKPEYDHFVELLGSAHPQEIYNTGCSLDNPPLMKSYISVIKKLQQYCTENNVAFMADPKAYVTLSQYGVFKNAVISGCFVADRKTNLGKDFPELNYKWLNVPHVLMDPAASDKLVDLEAALDFNRNYYQQTGDTLMAEKSINSFQRIKDLQKAMKHNMPFLFRPQ